MSDVAERVKKIVVEHLGVEESKVTETARNQLRRRGIRFAVEVHDGAYRPWPELAG